MNTKAYLSDRVAIFREIYTSVDTRALETDEGTVADTCPLRGWCVTVDAYYDVSFGIERNI